MADGMKNLDIFDGVIAYRNFAGRKDENNENGERTATFAVSIEDGLKLIEDGWYLRRQEFPNEPEREPRYLFKTTITFRTKDGTPKDPKVFIVREDGSIVHMTEDIIDQLDRADIVSVDANIGPWHWRRNGKEGVKAYVNCMYVKIKENQIEAKYRQMIDKMNESVIDTDPTSLPFPIE